MHRLSANGICFPIPNYIVFFTLKSTCCPELRWLLSVRISHRILAVSSIPRPDPSQILTRELMLETYRFYSRHWLTRSKVETTPERFNACSRGTIGQLETLGIPLM